MTAGWTELRAKSLKGNQCHASIEKISEKKKAKRAEISEG
jgi:hypothetical protein